MKNLFSVLTVATLVLALAACDETLDTKAGEGPSGEKGTEAFDSPAKLSENETYEMVVSFDDELSGQLAVQGSHRRK